MVKPVLLIFLSYLVCTQARAAGVCEELFAGNVVGQAAQFQVEIPQQGTIAKMEALHLLRYILPESFGPFSSKGEADRASRRLRNLINEAATQPFYKKSTKIVAGNSTPVTNNLHNAVIAEASRIGTPPFHKLWAQVGLGDAYDNFIGNFGDRKFTKSGMTLVQIYETLYKYVLRQNAYANWQKKYYSEAHDGGYGLSLGLSPTVRTASGNMKWASQNKFLLLVSAEGLPTGQVVWSEDGWRSAIVGVDADLSQKWSWGLPIPSLHRDLSGFVAPYSNGGPMVTVVDSSAE